MTTRRPFEYTASVSALFVWLTLSAQPAAALPRYGPIELSGNIAAQNLIRFNPDIDKYALVQQRNTLKLRLDYQLLEHGQMLDQIAVPFIDRSKMFLLYRGVYDSIYDSTPGFEQEDIYGIPSGVRLDQLNSGRRNSLKFNNELREAYIDLKLKTVPLSLRLGRQQIVWGETDSFRLLDRVNALDLTWHLQQESWDELRIPYWMIKGLWDVGEIGPLSNAFAEFYWNPGDWYPSKRDFLPRPWSVPLRNPLPTALQGFNFFGKNLGINLNGDLANGTTLFRQGDYTRNPESNSQVGARISAVTPQGVQFTANYFYQRWSGDDGTNTASFTAVREPAQLIAAVKRGELPIEAIAPYVHAAGFSLNYADEDLTQTVYRMESIYEFGVPFSDATKRFPLPGSGQTSETRKYLTLANAVLGNDVFGVSKRDMWKGTLAFDRPTWIRPVNRKATVLILGQFFWHYLLDNPNILCAKSPASGDICGGPNNPQIKGFRGAFATSGISSGGRPYLDKVRDWEVLTTLAATTFYKGGKIVPFLVYVLDPVNNYNMEVIWFFDYFVTNNLIVNVGQRYFINTVSHPVFESWGVSGINRGRSETGVRVTYQF